jgi:hypothetical protein
MMKERAKPRRVVTDGLRILSQCKYKPRLVRPVRLTPKHRAQWPALMGSTSDPKNGAAIGSTCYAAAVIYAAMIAFCGCQVRLGVTLPA